MQNFIEIEANDYGVGFAKLKQLESLLLLIVDRNRERQTKKTTPGNLFTLAHDLALDARYALDAGH